MKEWFFRNVEGGSLVRFIFVMVCAYGMGSLFSHDMRLQEYRTTQHLVHINGWVKPSVLKTIQFEEEK